MSDAKPLTMIDLLRLRPAMYLGDTGAAGLSRLIEAVLEFPRDPGGVLLHHRSRAEYLVEFVGCGVSLVPREGSETPYLVEVMSRFQVPLDHPPSVSGLEVLRDDLNPARFEPSAVASLGLSFARAFSARLEVTSTCRGRRGKIVCAGGEIVEPLSVEDVGLPDGLRVDMSLDPAIFPVSSLGTAALAGLVRDVANRRRLAIELLDAERSTPVHFRAPGPDGQGNGAG